MTDGTAAPDSPYARAIAEGRDVLRQTLLDAASRLLTEQGPQALSMRRIAQEFGCSTMVLYTVFQNKHELANALYLEGFARLEAILNAVPRSSDPLAYLRDIGTAYRASARANPNYYGVMFGRPIPEFAPPPASRARATQSLQILVTAVESAVDAGILRDEDPAIIAETLWAAIHGAISLELAGYFPDDAAADRCFENVARAAGAWFVTDPLPPSTTYESEKH